MTTDGRWCRVARIGRANVLDYAVSGQTKLHSYAMSSSVGLELNQFLRITFSLRISPRIFS
jgi:hypothetical protein